MKKIIIIGLALVSGAEAKAAWFCEDPYNSETCDERAVFEKHRVKEHEKLKKNLRFAGLFEATTSSGTHYIRGTAFLFETEKCPKNRFVMTAAHLKYHPKRKRGDRVSKKARFCLDSLDGKSWSSCHPLFINKKNILIESGWTESHLGEHYKDYLVAPFMEERPSSDVVATLVTLDSSIKNFSGFHESGFYVSDERMYLGTGCKNGGPSAHKYTIPHSCPAISAFSGGPLFYFDENGKPNVFGVNSGQTLSRESDQSRSDWRFTKRKYNPTKNRNNYGLRISSDLINRINRYCENYLNKHRVERIEDEVDDEVERIEVECTEDAL